MFPHIHPHLHPHSRVPRIRGGVPPIDCLLDAVYKCSPHTRGCSCGRADGHKLRQVFPAYAGVFLVSYLEFASKRCVPRIRGGVPSFIVAAVAVCRCSPHTRGCSQRNRCNQKQQHVFPAYAGVFLPRYFLVAIFRCVPRIRGGVPIRALFSWYSASCSPHTRGCS